LALPKPSIAPKDSEGKAAASSRSFHMHQQNEREYLERRQRLSEEKARAATDRGIARIHGDFAQAYARRLQQAPQPAAE
jgi:hypothetical protein